MARAHTKAGLAQRTSEKGGRSLDVLVEVAAQQERVAARSLEDLQQVPREGLIALNALVDVEDVKGG
eukprot:1101308-Alexandrium_andersonii.AAC.1